MTDPVDQEIEAIKCVLQALTPLSPKARASVMNYVVKRLDMVLSSPRDTQPSPGAPGDDKQTTEPPRVPEVPTHIKDLKEQKKPRSANEMAALVAYYLANLAPAADRKETVNHKDIETYFKIAPFPLPEHVRGTLANAKTAGYFDFVGDGEFRLNAVGHNLVVHSMPRGSNAPTESREARKKTARKQRIPKAPRIKGK